MIVEICVESYEEALIAEKAGCDRIELNSFLGAGGLTPYKGVVDLCVKNLSIPIVCMIRNRAAGFNYTDNEYKEILNELEYFLSLDIEGIVFGFLTENANIDRNRTKEFVNLIHKNNKLAIFSRAFDNCADPIKGIEDLIDLGVDRVLTSGQKNSAIEGSNLIKILVENYSSKIDILAGSGLTSYNIQDFAKNTGVKSVHSSCSSYLIDRTSKTNVDFSYKNTPNYNAYDFIDDSEVKKFVEAAKNI